MKIKLKWLDEVGSTSSWLASNLSSEMQSGYVVAARRQTAGRGQRGNGWESEPDKNLTFSLLLRPAGIDARHQFFISQAVALGIVGALRDCLPECDIRIKWPNDIYVGNRKICGILIENSLAGSRITHSIVGIGINVNQEHFISDAPNPVSIIQLSGQPTELEPLLRKVVDNIGEFLQRDSDTIHQLYMEALWGKSGTHYREASSGRTFFADITAIGPMGHMTLTAADGSSVEYAFKEVAVILPEKL